MSYMTNFFYDVAGLEQGAQGLNTKQFYDNIRADEARQAQASTLPAAVPAQQPTYFGPPLTDSVVRSSRAQSYVPLPDWLTSNESRRLGAPNFTLG